MQYKRMRAQDLRQIEVFLAIRRLDLNELLGEIEINTVRHHAAMSMSIRQDESSVTGKVHSRCTFEIVTTHASH